MRLWKAVQGPCEGPVAASVGQPSAAVGEKNSRYQLQAARSWGWCGWQNAQWPKQHRLRGKGEGEVSMAGQEKHEVVTQQWHGPGQMITIWTSETAINKQ